ncbi:MAG TPA: winged helix DNA-binding domain-containing protein [Pyrinomonadaceae bacterium]|nr:winged helix DNA-binding domain-containing protein [Pyrinomonadaceae bacterium]
MNKSAIVGHRLHNQKLASSRFQKPADVVRWLGAVQSQDFNAAKWALGLRMQNATSALIEDAFNRGEIVRTHVLRPTWHFVLPEDIRWMLELTGQRVNQKCGGAYRAFELDAAVFKRSHAALTKALRDGKHLTRPELKEVLNRSGVASDDNVRLAHILLRAETDGVVCSGPLKGKQFTYALLEERVPAGKKFSREEALAELTRRYFRSHGPASLQDFVWWSGLMTNEARLGIQLLDRELEETLIDDVVYWNSVAKRDGGPPRAPEAHLLPAFDEYNVAYKNRTLVLDPGAAPLVNKWDAIGPTFTVNGRIIGTWKSTVKKNSVTIDPLRTLKKSEKFAIATAVERYAAFLGVRGIIVFALLFCFFVFSADQAMGQRLTYPCGEQANDWDEKILNLPARLAAIKTLSKELATFNNAAWWTADLTSDKKQNFLEGEYSFWFGNDRVRLVMVRDPCYQTEYGGSNGFLLYRHGNQVTVTQALDGFFSRADQPLNIAFAKLNNEDIIEIATWSGGLNPSLTNYYFAIDTRSNRIVPRNLFKGEHGPSNQISSAMLLGDTPATEPLKLIRGKLLAKSFIVYVDDANGKIDDNGRTLSRKTLRFDGKLYR